MRLPTQPSIGRPSLSNRWQADPKSLVWRRGLPTRVRLPRTVGTAERTFLGELRRAPSVADAVGLAPPFPAVGKSSSTITSWSARTTQQSGRTRRCREVIAPSRSDISTPLSHCSEMPPCAQPIQGASSDKLKMPARSASSLAVRSGSALSRKLCCIRQVRNRPAKAPLSSWNRRSSLEKITNLAFNWPFQYFAFLRLMGFHLRQ